MDNSGRSEGLREDPLASSGRTGSLPDNSLRDLDDNIDSGVVLRDKSTTEHRRCKVVYSYTQVNEDELSLAVGDIIEFLGVVEEGWWRGRLKDRIGVFPSNFVAEMEPVRANAAAAPAPSNDVKSNRSSLYSSKEDLLNSSSATTPAPAVAAVVVEKEAAPILPPKPTREYCRVIYPYNPQRKDELELNTGDVITIISKELPDKGWWKGEFNDKVGVFPDNFVKLLPPDVSPSPNQSERTQTSGGTSKVFIKKSGSSSSTQSSNRNESFGSRDSLNDILSETGLSTGNVAAQRKSLENKQLDLTNNGAGDVAMRSARRSLDPKSELRKSVESLDEKKMPPPVLSKKPTVPAKKATSVSSVAGNLLSGLKSKVKSVEQKLSSSQDMADGLTSSKITSHVAESGEKGVVVERMKKDDVEFDNVERSSILPDMRSQRVKAPKRRPPSAIITVANTSGESNNNNSIYLNGSGSSYHDDSLQNSSTGSIDGEELAKPKPREWQKKKAPWMAELKASQEKKKTSPNVETRTKTESETTTLTSSSSTTSSHSTNYALRRSVESSQSFDVKTSHMQQQSHSSEPRLTSGSSVDMTKSMTAISASAKLLSAEIAVGKDDDVKIRPSSLSIRNRSVSPINRVSLNKSASVEVRVNSANSTAPDSNCVVVTDAASSTEVCTKVSNLEQRVHKLESIVQSQQRIIDELVRSLREETDKVKGLKTELDKYAQCVTQV